MSTTKCATLAVLTGAVLGLAAFDTSTSAEDRKSPSLVSVKQFGRGNVVGHLGHPLGTVVRITGVCIDGEKTRRRADLGETLLEIRTVDGTKLERPFTVPILRTANDVRKPKDGDSFDYYAHEWGVFDGVVTIPKELEIHHPMVANDGFHYRPQVTIHKANPSTLQQRSSTTP
jgi:hypothetical protein